MGKSGLKKPKTTGKKAKVNRKKGKLKSRNLLSFGDDEDEMPTIVRKKGKKAASKLGDPAKKLKIKKILSPFDLLKNDKTLSKEAGLSKEELAKMEEAKRQRMEKERIKH